MRVGFEATWSDPQVDAAQAVSQRQLAISVGAMTQVSVVSLPLNLCLILDHSGSMGGRPIETVKQAAQRILDHLNPCDRLSIVAFDHKAKVLISNQSITDAASIKLRIMHLKADGGTCIDEGLRLGIEELAKGKRDTVSHAFLLTDGENEHGDNDRVVKLAKLAADYSMTVSTLGFGDSWNQDVLEKIADAGGGSMSLIEKPDQAVESFTRLLRRLQSVGLTNAHLLVTLNDSVRLADLKPIAQVSPDTIELPVTQDGPAAIVRLGDLMIDLPRVVLVNLYVQDLPVGDHTIGSIQIRYDDPSTGQIGLLSESIPLTIRSCLDFQPQPNPQIQPHILALAKYRQTQIAEIKLKDGDRSGAATMLQTAAKTALQMGDDQAATVLQSNATRLQDGEDLSEFDRKKTRIVSKTMLQPDP